MSAPRDWTATAEAARIAKMDADAAGEASKRAEQRRERIATSALNGLLACAETHGNGSCEDIAAEAVAYADALIAALDKPEGK